MTTLYRYFLFIAHALYDKTTLKWLRKFSEQLLLYTALGVSSIALSHTWWLENSAFCRGNWQKNQGVSAMAMRCIILLKSLPDHGIP